MLWPNFIENVHSALKNGDTFNDFHAPMATEQDLTEIAGVPALLNQEWLKLIFCPFCFALAFFCRAPATPITFGFNPRPLTIKLP
jgi:hypothetical protein